MINSVLVFCVLFPLLSLGYWALKTARRSTLAPSHTPEAIKESESSQLFTDKGCCSSIGGEMKASNLSLSFPDWKESFSTSSAMGLQGKAYLNVRILLFTFMLSVMIWSIIVNDQNFWLIYLTHWTLSLEVGYLFLVCISTYLAQSAEGGTGKEAEMSAPAGSQI